MTNQPFSEWIDTLKESVIENLITKSLQHYFGVLKIQIYFLKYINRE